MHLLSSVDDEMTASDIRVEPASGGLPPLSPISAEIIHAVTLSRAKKQPILLAQDRLFLVDSLLPSTYCKFRSLKVETYAGAEATGSVGKQVIGFATSFDKE